MPRHDAARRQAIPVDAAARAASAGDCGVTIVIAGHVQRASERKMPGKSDTIMHCRLRWAG